MCAVSNICLYECNIYVYMSVSLHAPFKENTHNHGCIISNDADVLLTEHTALISAGCDECEICAD